MAHLDAVQSATKHLEEESQKNQITLVVNLGVDRFLKWIGVYSLTTLAAVLKLVDIIEGSGVSCFPANSSGIANEDFIKYSSSYCWETWQPLEYNGSCAKYDISSANFIQDPFLMKTAFLFLPYVMLLQGILFAGLWAAWQFRYGARLQGYLRFLRLLLENVLKKILTIKKGLYDNTVYDKDGEYFDGSLEYRGKEMKKQLHILKDPPSPISGNIEMDSTTNDSISIIWDEVKADGGSPILGYIIEKRERGTSTWARCNNSNNLCTDLRYTASNLRTDMEYEFRVIAVNADGKSDPSRPSKPIQACDPVERPGEASYLKLIDSTKSTLSFQWKGSENQGGADFLGYEIELKKEGNEEWIKYNGNHISGTSYTVRGLEHGASYSVRIRSLNMRSYSRWYRYKGTFIAQEFKGEERMIIETKDANEELELNDLDKFIVGDMRDQHLFSMLCFENFSSLHHFPYILSVNKMSGDWAKDARRTENYTDTVYLDEGILKIWCHSKNMNGVRLVLWYFWIHIIRALLAFIMLVLLAWSIVLYVQEGYISSETFRCELPFEDICMLCTIQHTTEIFIVLCIDATLMVFVVAISLGAWLGIRSSNNLLTCCFFKHIRDASSKALYEANSIKENQKESRRTT